MLQSPPKLIPVNIRSRGVGLGLLEIEELVEVAELVHALGLRAYGHCQDSVAFGCDVAVMHCVAVISSSLPCVGGIFGLHD